MSLGSLAGRDHLGSASPGQRESADSIAARVESLPTLPTVAYRLGELVNDPSEDSLAVAKEIERDPALCARLLKLANCAYYAVPGGVTTVRRALSFVGFNAVYQLALTVSVFDALPRSSAIEMSWLWRHSIGCAFVAQSVAKIGRFDTPEEVFTAGLLHDLGKIVLAAADADRYKRVIEMYRQADADFDFRSAEMAERLPSHDDVGRALAERWRLPGSLVAGIGYHHETGAGHAALPPRYQFVADAVAVGNLVSHRSTTLGTGMPVTPRVASALARLDADTSLLELLEEELKENIDELSAFFELLN